MDRRRSVRFDLDQRVLKENGRDLELGVETTFGRLRHLAESSEELFITPIAVDLLARREHTVTELRTKLRRRGFSANACDRAITRLHSDGLQSDERFAGSWVRSAMRGTGRSRAYLEAGLASRGVDRETAAKAIEEYEEENRGCFGGALEKQLRKTVRRVAPSAHWDGSVVRLDAVQRRTVLSRLMRRGFSTIEIQKHFA